MNVGRTKVGPRCYDGGIATHNVVAMVLWRYCSSQRYNNGAMTLLQQGCYNDGATAMVL
jgi:hypothetical protein